MGPIDRGRLDKRRAIVAAALRVFSRVGYVEASLDLIAREAGVAKPTIYNHLGGKAELFRYVMTETAAHANAKTLAVLAAFPRDPSRLRPGLEHVGQLLVDCYLDEDSTAVRRLLHAESARFPDLFNAVRASGADQFTEALAGHLARLANAGHLTIADPVRAAHQFVALVFAELPTLSSLGPDPLAPAEVAALVAAAVETFLCAYLPASGETSIQPTR